jgi:hypothetical protein
MALHLSIGCFSDYFCSNAPQSTTHHRVFSLLLPSDYSSTLLLLPLLSTKAANLPEFRLRSTRCDPVVQNTGVK